jgi:hypothetical protein
MARLHDKDLLPGPIRGVNRTALWKAWKAIRREVKNSSIRDVVDFLDYDVNPDVWINRLLQRIASGEYEPEAVRRFALGKSKGFSRTMTLPAIPDLVLYKAIVDFVYERSGMRKYKNVYFLRDEISKAQKKAFDEALGRMREARDVEPVDGQYRFTGRRSFYNWLRFDQYRKHLIYENLHRFIVIADIANFFDTVLHSHVARAVQSLPVPPRMIGLLFFLLEHLSMRQDYSSSHGISLPTDEFDCSRTLAHMVLYPHDDAMVELVGESQYVRWMDDQNMAIPTKADGFLVLKEVGRSLGRLHLTPNSQKSKVLSLEEARRHYHLDLNGMLDEAEVLAKTASGTKTARLRLQRKVREIWREARPHEGIGEFAKILKRLYRLAGLAGLSLLRSRSANDVLEDPSLVERVADYYRCTGTVNDYLDFVDRLLNDPEQVYADVNVALVESLLRVEPSEEDLPRLRTLARSLIGRKRSLPGSDQCAAVGTLLALRYGDPSIRRLVKRCFVDSKQSLPRELVRAAAFVHASHSAQATQEVREVASTVLRNHLSHLVRLIAEIQGYESVPERYRSRLSLSTDAVAGRKFIDMRVILTARLLLLSPNKVVRKWVADWRQRTLTSGISDYDRRLLRRLVIGRSQTRGHGST